MKILIVKLSAIGDVIHTLPALNAIRNHYPNAHITWLIEQAAYDIIKDHGALDRIIVSKRKDWIKGVFSRAWTENLREIMNFIHELKDTRYDLIFDFQALLKSGVLIGMAKGGKKIGFDKGMEHSECSYVFLNQKVKPVDMDNHALIRSLMLLESVGINYKTIEYKLAIQENERIAINNLFRKNQISDSKKLVSIHPIAKWETKLWHEKRFSHLADEIIAKYNAHVVFTGNQSDIPVINQIISCMKHTAINLAGKTTLKQLAALYEKSDILITTDTGPMHLAAAIQTPVVALFGPTAPWRTGPYGSNHQVVRKELDCSPCFKRECPATDCNCMGEISVQDVFRKVVNILKLH